MHVSTPWRRQLATGLALRNVLRPLGRVSEEKFASEEAKEGLTAWLQKRDPEWVTRYAVPDVIPVPDAVPAEYRPEEDA